MVVAEAFPASSDPLGLKPVRKSAAERAEERRSAARARTSELLEGSGHRLEVAPDDIGLLVCAECRLSVRLPDVPRWIRSHKACNGPLAIFRHPSHGRHLRVYRGLVFCGRCGGWAVRKGKKLAGVCTDPTRSGLRALGRIDRGLLPSGLRRWPEGV